MSLDNRPLYSGGCQCGAIRFHIEGALGEASVCHCRMCQKAFGSFYAPFVSVREAKLSWTRGEPKRFQSSNHVRRGFCPECGTPLTYEAPDGLSLAIGAFDDPASVPPAKQWGIEEKLPYVDEVPALPAFETGIGIGSFIETVESYQHPDHDTDSWEPGQRQGETPR